MLKYLIIRLAQVPITLVGVITVAFIILRLMPGDPVASYLGEMATKESIAAMSAKFGLDKPLYVQYWDTLVGTFTGNLGESFASGRSVVKEILYVLPHTVVLAGAALIISSLIGVLAGIVAALKRNKYADYVVMSFSLLGVSVPVFWLGLLLLLVFSYHLDLFPVTGVATGQSLIGQLHALVLPALTLGFLFMALVARITRSSMVEVLNSDFIRTVRAKGASERLVIYRHALRNALIPVVTVIGLNTGSLFAGAVLTETVFARPGIGKLLADSVLCNDYTLVQGIILLIGIIYIFVNLTVDILYAYLDPRIKYG
jgi:peptide/nickel transport system permease protein